MQSWVFSRNRNLIVLMIKIPLLRSGIFLYACEFLVGENTERGRCTFLIHLFFYQQWRIQQKQCLHLQTIASLERQP